MKFMFAVIASILGIFILIIAFEVFFATIGEDEVYKNPERTPRQFGNQGAELKYLVMGDSTSAGQGAPYEKGFATQTAEYLAKDHKIIMINSGVSGAKVGEILADQVPFAEDFKPDIVLISMSANDTVRLTSTGKIQADLRETIERILKANCNAKIVISGSPDMGTIPRFLPPLNWIATWHSNNVTNAMKPIIKEYGLTYAPIFEEVGPPFRKDPTLFAKDKYHANERGQTIWTQVLTRSLDQAMQQPSHCKS